MSTQQPRPGKQANYVHGCVPKRLLHDNTKVDFPCPRQCRSFEWDSFLRDANGKMVQEVGSFGTVDCWVTSDPYYVASKANYQEMIAPVSRTLVGCPYF